MNVRYRILKVDPQEHSIIVRYFTDIITEEMLCNEFDSNNNPILTKEGYPKICRTDYHINIFQTPSPSQEEILNIINQNAPVAWLKLQEDIKNPKVDTSLSFIKSLINNVGLVTIDLPPISDFANRELSLDDANTSPTNI